MWVSVTLPSLGGSHITCGDEFLFLNFLRNWELLIFVHLGICWTSASRRCLRNVSKFSQYRPICLPPQGSSCGPGHNNSCVVILVTKQLIIHQAEQNYFFVIEHVDWDAGGWREREPNEQMTWRIYVLGYLIVLRVTQTDILSLFWVLCLFLSLQWYNVSLSFNSLTFLDYVLLLCMCLRILVLLFEDTYHNSNYCFCGSVLFLVSTAVGSSRRGGLWSGSLPLHFQSLALGLTHR